MTKKGNLLAVEKNSQIGKDRYKECYYVDDKDKKRPIETTNLRDNVKNKK